MTTGGDCHHSSQLSFSCQLGRILAIMTNAQLTIPGTENRRTAEAKPFLTSENVQFRLPSKTSSRRNRIQHFGRHGDITPSNILWFDDNSGEPGQLTGTLKISDFGQTEMNSFRSKTRARDVPHTFTYRPPECDIGFAIIRQTFDIWGLGCVYLEFLTWFLGGKQLLIEFADTRMSPDESLGGIRADTFFRLEKGIEGNAFQATVKETVTMVSAQSYSFYECTE
jgi:serine/threonine protein kinase